MSRPHLIPLLMLIVPLRVFAQAPTAGEAGRNPDIHLWDPAAVLRAREAHRASDAAYATAIARLVEEADGLLDDEIDKVTDKPAELAEAVGGANNYASISGYFWPDPADPKAPWIMKDGVRNEELILKMDSPRVARMTRRVTTCGLAWYITGDRKYARKAAEQMRVWFLDPVTRMTPHMEYAQSWPNKSKGSPWGIIDVNGWPYMLDAVDLLRDSGEWESADRERLAKWMGEFVDWLQNSDLGRRERAAANNHGTFYDLILARCAITAGRPGIAREVASAFGPLRIDAQMGADGSTPHEQKRVDSAMYTCWNLKGFMDMVFLGRRLGVDLLAHKGPEGQSILSGARWLMPYVKEPSLWKHGNGHFRSTSPTEFFWMLAVAGGDPEVVSVLRERIAPEFPGERAGTEGWRSSRLLLLYGPSR